MPKLRIEAFGHPNITATHKSTWQLTTESEISIRADCIIGINASYSAKNLPNWLKQKIWDREVLYIKLKIKNKIFEGIAKGHPDLELNDTKDIVFRTSCFISDRTVGIECNFAANDIPESILIELKDSHNKLMVEIS